jgi:FkbH-like protein
MNATTQVTGIYEQRLTPVVRIEWQSVIFAAVPKRRALLELKADWACRDLSVAVHRNVPFEFVAQAMAPFLVYAGYRVEFWYSDYDDSLQFDAIPLDASLHIVWMDFDRIGECLQAEELVEWLVGRLSALRELSSIPIIVANWARQSDTARRFNDLLDAKVQMLPGVHIYDRLPILAQLGESYFDQRMSSIGATNMSGNATLLVSRDIGLRWIPAAHRPGLKCIAVDLDNTLYSGVLGEDGARGLTLALAHRAIQQQLLEYREQGIFLAAISKNEIEDVYQMFNDRDDFPLRREHFSAWSVNWNSKALGLTSISEQLNISVDAILFVDDNVGEIVDVCSTFPHQSFVHSADPTQCLAALRAGPDLLKWSRTTQPSRITDLAGAARRQEVLQSAGNQADYLAELNTELRFFANATGQLERMHELSQKTNQFNLALKRFNEASIAEWLRHDGPRAVTVQLTDRISDSGVIAMMLLESRNRVLFVEELCISCRALGRKIEHLLIAMAIDRAAYETQATQVAFAYAQGPRNGPARDWLEKFSGRPLSESEGYHAVSWPVSQIADRDHAISIVASWH